MDMCTLWHKLMVSNSTYLLLVKKKLLMCILSTLDMLLRPCSSLTHLFCICMYKYFIVIYVYSSEQEIL